MSLILGVFDQQEMHMGFRQHLLNLGDFPKIQTATAGVAAVDRPQFPGHLVLGFAKFPR